MQHVGVAGAVALVAGLLVAAALAAWERPGVRLWAAGVVVAGVAGANLAVERDAYVLTTAHADYAIEADAGARTLRVNGQNASREDGAGTGHPYIEWIEDRVYAAAPEGRPVRVLVVGAGGFTFGRGRPGDAAEIVFVDVDPRLAKVADAFLAPLPRRGRYAAMDGRAYLLRHEDRFDAIVLDAYADPTATPAHLFTREFFALARSRLKQDGTLYVNLIVPPRPDRLSTRADRTLRSVFAACRTRELGAAPRWRNRVYACPRTVLDGDATVYSDASGRADTDAGGRGVDRAGVAAGPVGRVGDWRVRRGTGPAGDGQAKREGSAAPIEEGGIAAPSRRHGIDALGSTGLALLARTRGLRTGCFRGVRRIRKVLLTR